MQTNWPTGGGLVVVGDEVLVEDDVELLLMVVVLVVGTMVVVVVVVVGAVVVVDVVLVDVDTALLALTGDSVTSEGELFDASHPVVTRTRVTIGSVTSLIK